MKKVFAIFLAAVMLFSFAACSASADKENKDGKDSNAISNVEAKDLGIDMSKYPKMETDLKHGCSRTQCIGIIHLLMNVSVAGMIQQYLLQSLFLELIMLIPLRNSTMNG